MLGHVRARRLQDLEARERRARQHALLLAVAAVDLRVPIERKTQQSQKLPEEQCKKSGAVSSGLIAAAVKNLAERPDVVIERVAVA
eukprot:3382485-Prymnesium_polylepis.1